jgi:hypothetical protein
MAHNKDWLPAGQEEFVVWSQKYVAGVSNYASPLGLPTAAVTALTTGQVGFMAAWNEYVIQEKSPSVIAGKRALVNSRKAVIRQFHNQHIRYNPNLTDEILAGHSVDNKLYFAVSGPFRNMWHRGGPFFCPPPFPGTCQKPTPRFPQ